MEKSCENCKFYEPIKRRGLRYPKGACHQHFAYRISDGWKNTLFIFSPDEYICDLHELNPQPIYAIVDDKPVLVPPVVANDLRKLGWVLVKLDESGGIVKQNDGEA